MSRVTIAITLVCLQLCPSLCCADVTLATLFRDGVVLQRDKPVAVWGWANAGETATVRFQGQTKAATPDAHGRWLVHLNPLKASATPDQLIASGNNTVTVNGVLVGDVWLCSGQSNMNLPLSATNDAKQEIARAKFPLIHYFDVKASILEEPAEAADGEWQVCSPETAGEFSAVGYYFATDIQLQLEVPIGIIKASLGGSPIEGWISADAIASTPASVPAIREWARMKTGYDNRAKDYRSQIANWKTRNAKSSPAGQSPSDPRPIRPWVDSDRNKPSGLYNGFIHPLEPFTLAGFLWYQGEGNVPRATDYKVLFPLMIEQWRRDFKQADLPFLFVQLPGYEQKSDATSQSWAWLRDAQAAALALPDVGMAVTIDIGDPVDIHPGNKKDVGQRLALIALRQVHGRQADDSGPTRTDIEPIADSLRIQFANARGLAFRGDPSGMFAVAGADRKFVPADSRIDGNAVIVSGKGVKAPVAVRFEWTNNPKGWLVNMAGLPAAPFRSDDWQPTH